MSGSAAEAASRRLLAGASKSFKSRCSGSFSNAPIRFRQIAFGYSHITRSELCAKVFCRRKLPERIFARAPERREQSCTAYDDSRAQRLLGAGNIGERVGERSALSTGRKRHTKIHRSHRRIILGGVTESAHSGCCISPRQTAFSAFAAHFLKTDPMPLILSLKKAAAAGISLRFIRVPFGDGLPLALRCWCSPRTLTAFSVFRQFIRRAVWPMRQPGRS